MPERLPDGIPREHLLAAIDDLDHNASHAFAVAGGFSTKIVR
jgi:hypothetical protein